MIDVRNDGDITNLFHEVLLPIVGQPLRLPGQGRQGFLGDRPPYNRDAEYAMTGDLVNPAAALIALPFPAAPRGPGVDPPHQMQTGLEIAAVPSKN